MARLDWKRGRFSVDYEQNEIDAALRGRVGEIGDSIDWYRYDAADSQVNDIYDEGYGQGIAFKGPFAVPVLHVVREEGADENAPQGRYYSDSVHVTAVFDMMRRAGFTFLDIDHQRYLRDRFVYDDRVFSVQRIAVLGQMQRRDVMVGIDATEMKADELRNDKTFERWGSR